MKDFVFPVLKDIPKDSAIYFSNKILKMFKDYYESEDCLEEFKTLPPDKVEDFVTETDMYNDDIHLDVWYLTADCDLSGSEAKKLESDSIKFSKSFIFKDDALKEVEDLLDESYYNMKDSSMLGGLYYGVALYVRKYVAIYIKENTKIFIELIKEWAR